MRKINEAYLSILKIELNDLYEDIEVLIEQCTQERESGRITNYVFMENLALFKNELLGVDAFEKIVRGTDPAAYGSLDEMLDHLKACFNDKIRSSGFPEVIRIYIERKLEKVRQYVTIDELQMQPAGNKNVTKV